MGSQRAQAERQEIFAEVQEVVDAFGRLVLRLQEDARHGSARPADVDALFRQAHTLKGLLGLLGSSVRSAAAHGVEDLLDEVRMGRRPLDAGAIDVLLTALEAFADDARTQGTGPQAEASFAALLPRLAAVQRGPRAGDAVEAGAPGPTDTGVTGAGPALGEAPGTAVPAELAGVLTAYEAHRFAEARRQGLPVAVVAVDLPLARCEAELTAVQAKLAEVGEVLTLLPSSTPAAVGEEPSLRFTLYVATRAAPEVLTGVLAQVVGTGAASSPVSAQPVPAPQPPPPVVPELLPAPPAPAPEPVQALLAAPEAPLAYTVRVDIRRLDRLMHWVNELSLTKLGLQELSLQLRRDHALVGPAVDLQREGFALERSVGELQAGLMALRMVPLAQLFERLVRSGHQAAHELGKEVRFVVRGEHVEVDKFVAEQLVDPLLHLVRNAVDHAVEYAAERRAAGKPPFGTVQLVASGRGSQVVVQVIDDGRGIDRAAVLRSAQAKGLIDAAQAAVAEDADVWRLMSAPGLSTRQQVNAFSGRGVGLDVAKTRLEQMGGSLDVHSDEGLGSTFSLAAPLTLAIVPAVVVAVGDEQLAVPVTHVVETVAIEAKDVLFAHGQSLLRVGKPMWPLVHLAAHLELCDEPRARQAARYALLLGVGHERLAVAVDDLVSQQDIIVKTLGPRLRRARPFAGAAELASKRMVLVLDGAALVQEVAALPGASARREAAEGHA